MGVKRLWAGMGFQHGVTALDLLQALTITLQAHSIERDELIGIATLESKRQDSHLQNAAQAWGIELCFFTAAQLNTIPVPNPSPIAQAKVQVASIAEAAALLASSEGELIVPKQIYRTAQQLAITLALSRIKTEVSEI